MGGTLDGGKKASVTNKTKYGNDFYKKIGSLGGKAGKTGGFCWMKANGQLDKIREAGRKGGRISKRKKMEE